MLPIAVAQVLGFGALEKPLLPQSGRSRDKLTNDW